MGCSKSNSKREVYSNQSYLKKQEKHRIDNLTFHLKHLEKEEGKKKSKNEQKERNHEDPSRKKMKKK